MDIRKIAVVGSFAAGAALAFAPLASADTPITTTVDSEIASLNSLFEGEAALAGDTAEVYVRSSSILFYALVGLSFTFYELIIVLLREVSFFALQSHSLYAT